MNVTEHWGDNLIYAIFLSLPLLSGGLLLCQVRSWVRAGRPRKGPVVILGNLTLLVFLSALTLAVAETWHRFGVDTTDSFGRTRINMRWFERHWRLNQMGYRDSVTAYLLQRPPGKRRLSFLGDSFTAGHGVAEVEDRFANLIRNRGGDEVHVWADLGYDTGHAIELVQSLITNSYQFDRVILVYTLNDIGDLSPEWRAMAEAIRSAPPPPFLVRHSFFLDTWYYRLQGRLNPDISNYCQSMLQYYDGPLWAQQEQRLQTLRQLVETHGGQFLVVTFPFLQHLGPAYEFRSVHARLGACWHALGVPHLDLLPLYDAHRGERLTVNGHDAHPNERAHALAADAIKEFIERNSRQ
ncbi:MAG TPA: SGNH/GDSL hydrolase family protein [Candidatus Paceibacterota bacterium]|nr:SGNH/GDSL hydrolase family protein [Verrucomicrobiota bacterium]HSA11921.1 SGNH/GDSL hydrolase family protein [Candidatus Paceibacterota bacterium]